MNSTIIKTFYTFSIEPLFLRYKKISKKAVKLVHDDCVWKIKNFVEPYHEELSSKA